MRFHHPPPQEGEGMGVGGGRGRGVGVGGGGGDGGPVSLPALGRADSRLCSDLSPSLSLKGHVGGVPSLRTYMYTVDSVEGGPCQIWMKVSMSA